MTSLSDLPSRLRQLTADQLSVPPTQLVRDATLVDDLGVDSLAAIEWGMAIEDAFGLALPEDAMERVSTYGDVEELVLRLAPAQG